MKITTKDKRILCELWSNSRSSSLYIAKRVGLSREVVDYRIKRLVKEKAIKGFVASVDNEKIGFTTYLINIQLQEFNEQKLKEIINYFKAHRFVKWVASCSGKWDLIIVMTAKNKFHFDELFSEISNRLSNNLKNYEILTRLNVMKDAAIGFIKDNNKELVTVKKNKPDSFKLDKKDMLILNELNKRPRGKIIDIATSIRMSPETTRQRIKNLEKQKIITNYRPVINVNKLGYMMFMIFLETNVIDKKKERELITFFSTIPNIHYVEKYIGRYPLSIELVAKDNEEFHNVLIKVRNKLSQLIKSYELIVILEQHKQESFPQGIIDCFED
jgi:Lrp/AsnC family leucine-responsive transcriptional regulator